MTKKKDTRRLRRLENSRVEDVYRRLSELVQTKGFLSAQEARDLLSKLDSGLRKEQIGPYKILDLLGEGATASVYAAMHEKTRRVVALKVLSHESLNDPERHAHFVREAKAVMLLRHPNIVRGVDIGDTLEHCYIALEYIDGRTLRDLVTKLGALGELESLYIIRQIAYGLEYTYRCDMVHLDIKPENIVIDDNTLDAKMFDLGTLWDRTSPDISTITVAAVHPRYASPEILSGNANADVRSDIYSLGLCLFFMLTGAHAFVAVRNPLEVEADRKELSRKLREVDPALSDTMIVAVLKMTEYQPTDRPATPAELMDMFVGMSPEQSVEWNLPG